MEKAFHKVLYYSLIAIPWSTVITIVFVICSIFNQAEAAIILPFCSYTAFDSFFSSFVGSETGLHQFAVFVLGIMLFVLGSRAVREQKIVMPALVLPYLAWDIKSYLEIDLSVSGMPGAGFIFPTTTVFDVFVMVLILAYLVTCVQGKNKAKPPTGQADRLIMIK